MSPWAAMETASTTPRHLGDQARMIGNLGQRLAICWNGRINARSGKSHELGRTNPPLVRDLGGMLLDLARLNTSSSGHARIPPWAVPRHGR